MNNHSYSLTALDFNFQMLQKSWSKSFLDKKESVDFLCQDKKFTIEWKEDSLNIFQNEWGRVSIVKNGKIVNSDLFSPFLTRKISKYIVYLYELLSGAVYPGLFSTLEELT